MQRDPAVDHAAADAAVLSRGGEGPVHTRVVAPELLAGARVDGKHDAPVGDAVEDAVPDERGRFLIAAPLTRHLRPGEPEPRDDGRGDLVERAVAPLARIVSVRDPLTAPPGIPQGVVVKPLPRRSLR